MAAAPCFAGPPLASPEEVREDPLRFSGVVATRARYILATRAGGGERPWRTVPVRAADRRPNKRSVRWSI